jgi:hypothetical protein
MIRGYRRGHDKSDRYESCPSAKTADKTVSTEIHLRIAVSSRSAGRGFTDRGIHAFTTAALAGLTVLAQLAFGVMSISSGSAANAMTIKTSTVTVTARLLLTIPVKVVCAPLPDTAIADDVSVSIEQANSKTTISSASTFLAGGPGSFEVQNPLLFTCDGTTKNTVKFSMVGSGPFHAGAAIITIDASHTAGTCQSPRFCQTTGSESAQLGPVAVTLVKA